MPGRSGAKEDLLRRIKAVQALLGRYEELAEFKRWGKDLSVVMQERIRKDWRKARRRARGVPGDLAWLMDALVSGHVWIEMDQKRISLGLENLSTV